MKKLFLIILSLFLFAQVPCFAEIDWDELYENSQPFGTKLMHDIDPYEDEDNFKYAYPLSVISDKCRFILQKYAD